MVPLSLFFFFLGVATAYFILPSAFGYFASFLVSTDNGVTDHALSRTR